MVQIAQYFFLTLPPAAAYAFYALDLNRKKDRGGGGGTGGPLLMLLSFYSTGPGAGHRRAAAAGKIRATDTYVTLWDTLGGGGAPARGDDVGLPGAALESYIDMQHIE